MMFGKVLGFRSQKPERCRALHGLTDEAEMVKLSLPRDLHLVCSISAVAVRTEDLDFLEHWTDDISQIIACKAY